MQKLSISQKIDKVREVACENQAMPVGGKLKKLDSENIWINHHNIIVKFTRIWTERD